VLLSSATSTDRANYLNLALMLTSALAAFVLPFEVFLVAYAILGPLHYLTEISWLHDRQYFLERPRDHLSLVLLCLALLAISLTPWGVDRKHQLTIFINYIAFAGAAALLMTPKYPNRAFALMLIGLSFFLVQQSALCCAFFGVLLATIVHTLVFTGAFVLWGALRNRSRSGLASLITFTLCAMSFFFYAPMGPVVSHHVREAYAPFEFLNLTMMRIFDLAPITSSEVIYRSAPGLAMMRLIAFAYLYHYLNWFSKTSIIGWNRMSLRRATAIVALWMVSMGLYASGSRIGLTLVVSLSFLHGFLELPLDHRTFVNIGRELAARLRQPVADGPSKADSIAGKLAPID